MKGKKEMLEIGDKIESKITNITGVITHFDDDDYPVIKKPGCDTEYYRIPIKNVRLIEKCKKEMKLEVGDRITSEITSVTGVITHFDDDHPVIKQDKDGTEYTITKPIKIGTERVKNMDKFTQAINKTKETVKTATNKGSKQAISREVTTRIVQLIKKHAGDKWPPVFDLPVMQPVVDMLCVTIVNFTCQLGGSSIPKNKYIEERTQDAMTDCTSEFVKSSLKYVRPLLNDILSELKDFDFSFDSNTDEKNKS